MTAIAELHVYERGRLVKMKNWDDYTSRKINPWAWLKVLENGAGRYLLEVMDGDRPTGQTIDVPHSTVAPPIGWEQVYDVIVGGPVEAERVLSWLADRQGVSCWISHDLSTPGRRMFTPGDRAEKPHWSMELVEIVTDQRRIRLLIEEVRDSQSFGSQREKAGWTWDKQRREWYRRVPYVKEIG